MASRIQTVLFAKSQWTVERAKSWLRSHDFKAGDPDVTENNYRFRQFDPATCARGSFKTLTQNFPAGVSAVSCSTGKSGAEKASAEELEDVLMKIHSSATTNDAPSQEEIDRYTGIIAEQIYSKTGVLWEENNLRHWLDQSPAAFFGYFFRRRAEVTRDRGVAVVRWDRAFLSDDYKTLLEAVREQVDDGRTRAVLLSFDSPGGVVNGMFEASRELASLGEKKPLYAFTDNLMASAAYGLGSAARSIMGTASSQVGSIGVVALHADYSQMLKNEGIKPTYFYAGKYKTAGNRYEPLSRDAKEMIQAMIDKTYDQFVGLIGENRPSLGEDEARGTEAQVYTGRDAVDAGLVDWIAASQDEAVELIVEEVSTKRSNGVSSTKNALEESKMSVKSDTPAPEKAAEQLAAKAGEGKVAEVVDLDEARKKAEEQGRAAEQARNAEIIQLCELAGLPAMIKDFINNSKLTIEEVRAALLKARAEKDSGKVSGYHADKTTTSKRLVDSMAETLKARGMKPRDGIIPPA